MLLKSLVIIGAILGLLLGVVGTSVPWLFPRIFTQDQNVIHEVSSCLLSLSVIIFMGLLNFFAFGLIMLH